MCQSLFKIFLFLSTFRDSEWESKQSVFHSRFSARVSKKEKPLTGEDLEVLFKVRADLGSTCVQFCLIAHLYRAQPSDDDVERRERIALVETPSEGWENHCYQSGQATSMAATRQHSISDR